ncbi:cytochrome P450 [Kitasatospora sp. NPDC059722]|uniref:cytochrome P450 n=1 Tax=Kitasatospora sp. NPDC059722 TaxID=3346925 RepID=UPI0036C5110C
MKRPEHLWERRVQLAAHPLAYPFITAVARRGPAVRVPGIGIVVGDPGLARQVLLDHEGFRKDGPGSSGALWTPVLGPAVLLNMEGEEHRRLRAALTGLFTRAQATELCTRVLAPVLREATDRLAAGGAVDLVALTRTAAGTVIGELLGVSDTAGAEVFERGERIVRMVGLRTRELTPRQVAKAKAVLAGLVAQAGEAYDRAETGSMMGRLRGHGLDREQALGLAAAFLLTGTETVATTVPRVFALWHDSGLLPALRADLETGGAALDPAIDEAMRVITPSPAMLRRAARPGLLGTTEVREGDRVLIATARCDLAAGPFDRAAALGRCPAHDPKRLWFGAGPHYCIGAPLALAEIRVLLQALLTAGVGTIVRRRAKRRVLIPTYARLEVSAAQATAPQRRTDRKRRTDRTKTELTTT